MQRPSARELLKHKFIRMAKKTSYLTELIERHERWKAEGGDRHEDDEQDHAADLYDFVTEMSKIAMLTFCYSPASGDPEDLWDFGTVRHASRPGTIGRAQQNPIQVSGPPSHLGATRASWVETRGKSYTRHRIALSALEH